MRAIEISLEKVDIRLSGDIGLRKMHSIKIRLPQQRMELAINDSQIKMDVVVGDIHVSELATKFEELAVAVKPRHELVDSSMVLKIEGSKTFSVADAEIAPSILP